MRIIVALVLLACTSIPAAVEEDYMEVQRCVWRCLAGSKGADDPAYNACVERLCSGNPSKSEEWTFSEHPALGLSAHVNIGSEAFGIACMGTDANSDSNYVASLRMTRGLAPATTKRPGMVMVFVQPFYIAGQGIFTENPLGFVETLGGYCSAQIKELRSSKKLLFLREKIIRMNYSNAGSTLIVQKDGPPVSIQSVRDLNNLAEAIAVPLKGARKAIDQLLKTCPSVRRLMNQDCTGGH
ncbi:MAG: hypothetical protein SGJ17_06450 [Hyphomicrobiales bacterium]|nr:hypothetical protein [Hyphomicrobiales bacterium]